MAEILDPSQRAISSRAKHPRSQADGVLSSNLYALRTARPAPAAAGASFSKRAFDGSVREPPAFEAATRSTDSEGSIMKLAFGEIRPGSQVSRLLVDVRGLGRYPVVRATPRTRTGRDKKKRDQCQRVAGVVSPNPRFLPTSSVPLPTRHVPGENASGRDRRMRPNRSASGARRGRRPISDRSVRSPTVGPVSGHRIGHKPAAKPRERQRPKPDRRARPACRRARGALPKRGISVAASVARHGAVSLPEPEVQARPTAWACSSMVRADRS